MRDGPSRVLDLAAIDGQIETRSPADGCVDDMFNVAVTWSAKAMLKALIG
jgi:hypothetical protein